MSTRSQRQTGGTKRQETLLNVTPATFTGKVQPHFTFPKSVTDRGCRSTGRQSRQSQTTNHKPTRLRLLASPTTQLASQLAPSLLVTLFSEQSFGIAKYDQMRQTLKKFMGRVSTIPNWGENWQSHTTNVRKGAVIEIPLL
jgi:hypothetical protein